MHRELLAHAHYGVGCAWAIEPCVLQRQREYIAAKSKEWTDATAKVRLSCAVSWLCVAVCGCVCARDA